MPSPDLTAYVDLTLYDEQPSDIYDDAVAYAQIALPEFDPRAGSVETAILQAIAQMTGFLGGAINRMTPGLLEVVLQLFGIERNSGTQATGSLTVTAVDNLGYTLPLGTRFGYLDNSDPENPFMYAFDTTQELTIAPGNTTGAVPIAAVFFQKYPALPAATPIQLITPTAFVQSAALASTLAVGADPETDAEFFARAVSKINSYSTALTLPSQMTQYVLSTYTEPYRVQTYSLVKSSDDLIASPDYPGYVTCYVSKSNGASLSVEAMTAIETDLRNRSTAGLILDVKQAWIQDVDVDVEVTTKPGYVSGDVVTLVEAGIEQYMSPAFWPWLPKVYYNEVISLVDQIEGVDRVVNLTLDGGTTDITFTRYGTLVTNSTTVTTSV